VVADAAPVSEYRRSRRAEYLAAARFCYDHLAGALGSAVGTRFLEAGWVTRHRSGRGLTVTAAGRAVVRETWAITLTDADPAHQTR
jgi:hypothetical protein